MTVPGGMWQLGEGWGGSGVKETSALGLAHPSLGAGRGPAYRPISDTPRTSKGQRGDQSTSKRACHSLQPSLPPLLVTPAF